MKIKIVYYDGEYWQSATLELDCTNTVGIAKIYHIFVDGKLVLDTKEEDAPPLDEYDD